MNGSYEWQRQQAQQRIHNRYQESQQHRLSKQQNGGTDSEQDTIRSEAQLPLRLISTILFFAASLRRTTTALQRPKQG